MPLHKMFPTKVKKKIFKYLKQLDCRRVLFKGCATRRPSWAGPLKRTLSIT